MPQTLAATTRRSSLDAPQPHRTQSCATGNTTLARRVQASCALAALHGRSRGRHGAHDTLAHRGRGERCVPCSRPLRHHSPSAASSRSSAEKWCSARSSWRSSSCAGGGGTGRGGVSGVGGGCRVAGPGVGDLCGLGWGCWLWLQGVRRSLMREAMPSSGRFTASRSTRPVTWRKGGSCATAQAHATHSVCVAGLVKQAELRAAHLDLAVLRHDLGKLWAALLVRQQLGRHLGARDRGGSTWERLLDCPVCCGASCSGLELQPPWSRSRALLRAQPPSTCAAGQGWPAT